MKRAHDKANLSFLPWHDLENEVIPHEPKVTYRYLLNSFRKSGKVSKVSCTKFQISRQNAACRKKHIGWQPTMCGRDLATIAHLICNKCTGLTLIYLNYNRQQTQVLTNKHIQYIHLSSHVIFLSNVAGPYNAEAPDQLVGPFGLDPHSHSERSPAL